MAVNHEEFRKKIIYSIYENNKYHEGKSILIDWWNKSFEEKYKVISAGEEEPSIFSRIKEIIESDVSELSEEITDVIISISGIMSKIVFFTEPLGDHYEKAFLWLDLVRPLAREYKDEFTDWFWNRYVDMITYTGRKVHIMEIPIEAQSDTLKIAYCDYLHLTNQGGIKEIRRILSLIGNDSPRIQIMKYKTLCDIYADSPSQRNNKQIKEFAKKVVHYSSDLKEETEKKKNIKYFWFLKSAIFSLNSKSDFYSLQNEEQYDEMVKNVVEGVNNYIYSRETIKAAIDCIVLVNFAVKNGHFEDASLYILWFLSIVEGFNHIKALEIHYFVYKSMIDILLSLARNPDILADGRLMTRFNKVDKIFFNEDSIECWEKIDFVLKKKVLSTSPLGKITQRIIETYFDMAYIEAKKVLSIK